MAWGSPYSTPWGGSSFVAPVGPIVPPAPTPGPYPGTERFPWTLHDPSTGDSYVFPINPTAGKGSGSSSASSGGTVIGGAGSVGEHSLAKTIELATMTDNGPILTESQQDTLSGSFGGTILSQAQYDAFVFWSSKDNLVRLTDDLGRVQTVFFTGFSPARKHSVNFPWDVTYTVSYLIYAIEDF